MKDKQGIQRGKCNECECEEYMSPPQAESSSKPAKLRCEYCDHVPVDHVRIIELGACRKCGQDNCDKYESDDANSYTDCQYCGCQASHHIGAEKLRKKPSASNSGIPGRMIEPTAAPGLTLRTDPVSGTPAQTAQHGLCMFPGCQFPKRVENGHVLDFCSRTCSRKNQSSQGPPPSGSRQQY